MSEAILHGLSSHYESSDDGDDASSDTGSEDFLSLSKRDDDRKGSDPWITPETLQKVASDSDQFIVKKKKPTIFMSQHVEKTEADEEVKPTFEQGMRPEVLPLYQAKSDGYRINWVETKPYDLDYDDVEIEDQKKEYAILVRNRRSRSKYALKAFEIDSVVIWSPLIKKVLKQVMDGYPGITLELSEVEFSSPFLDLVHRWDRLIEAIESETDEQTKQHIELFRNTIFDAIGPLLGARDELVKIGVATYDLLRIIAQPCEWMVNNRTGELGLLEKVDWMTDNKGEDAYCAIVLNNIDWNGSYIGYGTSTVTIDHFEGTKSITDLPCYPLRYAADVNKIRTEAIDNGKKFMSLAGVYHKSYTHSSVEQSRADRIIIDAKAYYAKTCGSDYRPGGSYSGPLLDPLSGKLEAKANRFNGCNGFDQAKENGAKPTEETIAKNDAIVNGSSIDSQNTKGPSTRNSKLATTKKALTTAEIYNLTDSQLMLCRRSVLGFTLKSKKWSSFSVAHIRDIKFDDSVFDNLVLPQAHKDIILGFVETQIDRDHNRSPRHQDADTDGGNDADSDVETPAAFDDFIEGKGRGLIFLLSGPPGVGKTFTVEAVAERLHAPLYPFSAIELGHSVATVELAFKEMLDTAGKWGAVLLLDEADVFLIQRTVSDLERNRLVSVFLRLLEYFEGVLFLTTNRASELDEAFDSRVDVHLEYPPLDTDSRCAVWTNFIAQVLGPVEVDEEEIQRISKVPVNGREIKSVIKQALLLNGGGKKGPLKAAHIETVLKIRKARQIVG